MVSDGAPKAVIVEGGPRIGKTTLWRSCVASASAAGVTVLASVPSQAEQGLGFGGLSDMLAARVGALEESLPAPQLR
jgi:hypothetical protein